jgi:hypothetical protein
MEPWRCRGMIDLMGNIAIILTVMDWMDDVMIKRFDI